MQLNKFVLYTTDFDLNKTPNISIAYFLIITTNNIFKISIILILVAKLLNNNTNNEEKKCFQNFKLYILHFEVTLGLYSSPVNWKFKRFLKPLLPHKATKKSPLDISNYT